MEEPGNTAVESPQNNVELPKNSSDTFSRYKRIIFIAFGVAIVVVLVSISFFLIDFKKTAQQNQTKEVPTNSITKSPSDNDDLTTGHFNYDAPFLIVYSNGRADVPDRGGVIGGDMYLYDPVKNISKKITNNQHILYIHALSPDKKYVSVVIKERDKDLGIKESFGIVDIKTGNLSVIQKDSNTRGKIHWYADNSVIGHILPDKIGENSVDIYTINDGSKSELHFPDLVSADFYLSQDKRWAISGNDHFNLSKIYSYEIPTKRFLTIVNERVNLLGWKENKLIYSLRNTTENAVYEITPDGSERTKLFNTGSEETVSLFSSKDGSVMLVNTNQVENGKTRSGVYVYKNQNKIKEVINGLNIEAGFSGITQDGKYGLYSHKGERYLFDLNTFSSKKLNLPDCGIYCFPQFLN